MKLKGKAVTQPKPITFSIYRVPEPVTFTVQAVIDYSEFEELCPNPPVPTVKKVGQTVGTPDPTNAAYQKKVAIQGERRTHWMMLKALSATEGLEWETVDLKKPETWENFETELRAIFTPFEMAEIQNSIFLVNAPSKESFQEAVEAFQHGQPEV